MKTIFSTILFAALWWLLTAGSVSSWILGVPAVVAAVWASRKLLAEMKISFSLTGLLHFVPYFLLESLRGGIDVALRTLSPRLNIQPEFCQFDITIETPIARVFFCNCLSLLPGTLCVESKADSVDIHSLKQQADIKEDFRKLEHMVCQLFNLREATT